MLPLYNLAIRLYFIIIGIASLFNNKAKKWIQGRKHQYYVKTSQSVWFHFASLGEFEQGRPVLEQMRQQHAGKKIIITFFSPSGYEIRKNTPLADAVYYLPLDTAANARKFIDAIDPAIAIFTKYEYWYHFFNLLNKRGTPLYIISGIFRPKQIFFKWYGSLHRRMLGFVNHFFVQDDASKKLLAGIGITNVTVSGDTRFDRVWENAQQPKELPLIATFKNSQKILVAGSTWPADEQLLVKLITTHPDWKFIIAPHEIESEQINELINLLPQNSTIRFSQADKVNTSTYQTLIIDNIGMLSSLYQYGEVAYIGGGFGAGIHNTLEAAAFGLPVIFGPNYQKFREARDMVAQGTGFSISNETELLSTFNTLIDDTHRLQLGEKIKEYVKANRGATGMILSYIKNKNQ